MSEFSSKFLQKLCGYEKQIALIYDDESFTYKDLLENVKEKMSLIKDISKDKILALRGDFDIDSIGFFLACVELKRIFAPFIKDDEIKDKIKEAGIYALYEDKELKFYEENANFKHDFINELIKKDEAGLILFSSGSTGKAKAIVHSLDKLLLPFLDKKPKKMNILLFLMFDHIGGLNTLFNCLSMGACGLAIKDRKNVELLAACIQKYKIALLPASPSLLNLFLLSNLNQRYDLSSLKLITYGTEKMPESLLERLKNEFKKVRFHQTFGTSEVGINQTKSYENYIKLENVEYKIVNDELFLKSKTQSLGYLNADNAVFDEDGYFATGDLVELKEINGEQYLKIIGRSKELINVGGEKVLPQELEAVLLELDFVKDCLVYGKANALTGQMVCAKIVLKDEEKRDMFELKKEIKSFLKAKKIAAFKIPAKIDFVAELAISSRFKKVRK